MGRHWGGISWSLVPRLPSLVLRPPLLIPAPRSLVAPKWVDRSGCALAWRHTAHRGRLRLLLATASSLSAFGAIAGAEAALLHLVAKLHKDHPHLLENPPPGPTTEQAQRAAALLLLGGDAATLGSSRRLHRIQPVPAPGVRVIDRRGRGTAATVRLGDIRLR